MHIWCGVYFHCKSLDIKLLLLLKYFVPLNIFLRLKTFYVILCLESVFLLMSFCTNLDLVVRLPQLLNFCRPQVQTFYIKYTSLNCNVCGMIHSCYKLHKLLK